MYFIKNCFQLVKLKIANNLKPLCFISVYSAYYIEPGCFNMHTTIFRNPSYCFNIYFMLSIYIMN